jgi:diguanylate cyclase (GGDEF)-like protein
MHLSYALNATFGSGLIIALILADYLRKYNTDRFQRSIFCNILIFALVSLICDLLFYLIKGIQGETFFNLNRLLLMGYYIFQVLCYYHILIFVDYTAFKDLERTKKITKFVWIINILHLLILLLNMKLGFYFYITSPENMFFYGDQYFIRLIISYAPAVFLFFDAFSSLGAFKRAHIHLILIFLGLTFFGSTLDIAFGTASLIWPCFAGALLYAYFFIIKTDTRIDSLTKIGNRYSFNEFTASLSRLGPGEAYSIVMIDMDHFKKINDTLGHLEGDNALRDMAAILKSCIRSSDFAARYGGDEFVLAAKAERNIQDLMTRIQTAIDLQNNKQIRPYQIQMSYGYDVYSANDSRTIDEFLNHIDGLMYKHKERRRRTSDINSAEQK